MSIKFNMTRDVNGYNGYGIQFQEDPNDGFECSLTENIVQSVTVPSNYPFWIAIFTFRAGSNIWVANNSIPVLPTGTMTSSVSDPIPTARQVKAGDVLSFITGDTDDPWLKVSFQYILPSGGS